MNIELILGGCWRRESHQHGERHWYAVAATAVDLAERTPGADREVCFLFGLLHDSSRTDDGRDEGHGPRAARFARELDLESELGMVRMGLLTEALAWHPDGRVSGDPTVGCCWDGDRLQLRRFGYRVDRRLLSTRAAKSGRARRRADARRDEPVDWAALYTRAS